MIEPPRVIRHVTGNDTRLEIELHVLTNACAWAAHTYTLMADGDDRACRIGAGAAADRDAALCQAWVACAVFEANETGIRTALKALAGERVGPDTGKRISAQVAAFLEAMRASCAGHETYTANFSFDWIGARDG